MIEGLFYITIDLTIILLAVMLLRNPVRRLLGAHIAYGLWMLPLVRILIPQKFNRPDVIVEFIDLPSTHQLIPQYSQAPELSPLVGQSLIVLWLVGAMLWLVLKALNGYHFEQYLRQHAVPSSTPPGSKWLPANWPDNIKLFQLDVNQGPLITGLWRLRIYLPADFHQRYSEQQRLLMLDHELSHARRKDLWTQLIWEVVRSVFWFNPMVHLAYHQFRADQELACDYDVLKNADSKTKAAYGEALKKGLVAQLMPRSMTFFYHRHERFLMLKRHEKNMGLNAMGLLFTVLAGWLLVTETVISSAPKSDQHNGPVVSYQFNQTPLSIIVQLVNDSTGGQRQLEGMSLIENTLITAHAERIHVYDFLDALLEDNHFKMTRNDGVWRIVRLGVNHQPSEQ